jgi:hypothetical protein
MVNLKNIIPSERSHESLNIIRFYFYEIDKHTNAETECKLRVPGPGVKAEEWGGENCQWV